MGGAEMGGPLSSEHLRDHYKTGRESANKVSLKNRVGTIAKKSAIILSPIAIATGVVLVGDTMNIKNDRIEALEERNRDQDRMLDAAVELGRSGVQFAGIRILEDDVVVAIPGTGARCRSISFEYTTNNNGWMLSIEQVDKAGNVYDEATATNAQSVSALVEDLCS